MKTMGMALLLTIFSGSPTWAAVVFHMEKTSLDTPSSQAEHSQFTVDGKRLRVDTETEVGTQTHSMIYLGDRDEDQKEMLIVEHENRRVIRMNRQAAQEMANQMNQMMKNHRFERSHRKLDSLAQLMVHYKLYDISH